MPPRRYAMNRRAARAEETRRRIVEATVALHSQKGILGTSWKDIAERADVSVATVYNHFPSLEELVPACGEWIFVRTQPPSREDAAGAFEGVEGLEERIARLVRVFYAFYERGEPYLEVDNREREMPAVQEWEAETRATREEFTREALRQLEPDERTVRTVSALLDFPVFKSFRRHDLEPSQAEAAMLRLLLSLNGPAAATA
jgi:AcrR family transcriptional regulator